MRRAATSANVLRLPELPSTRLEIVGGRQRVLRQGLFFTTIAKRRRAVYTQLDGETALADECRCRVEWPEEGGDFGLTFRIQRETACPIDEHRRLALQEFES